MAIVGKAPQSISEAMEEARQSMMRGETTDKPSEPLRMPDNPLDGFRNGVCLDLRVRFAMELLAHSPMFQGMEGTAKPKQVAEFALDLSTELFALADARGLIEPLDSPEGTQRMGDHIERQIPYQAKLQVGIQQEGQRLQQEIGRIARSVAGAFGKPRS